MSESQEPHDGTFADDASVDSLGADALPSPRRQPSEAARIHQALRQATAPPSLLVDAQDDVLHVSDRAAPLLCVSPGAPTRALTTLLRLELRAAAQTALVQARRDGREAEVGPVWIDLDGQTRSVVVRAHPASAHPASAHPASADARAPDGALVQVVLDVLPAHASPDADDGDNVLAEALRQSQEQLQHSAAEFESSREELRAQNEELQSINEELRATAEELETSKEEAQSMAEELQTVNDALTHKVSELAQTTGDLENLIASTEIATLFLDRELRIQRFTPPVQALFGVRDEDVGRPLADLAQRFGGGRLVEDANAVLARLERREREAEGRDGRWYLVRARPYRTVGDHIDGVVVTFVDISQRKADEEAIRQSEARYRTLFESIDEGFCVIEMIEDEAGTPVDCRFLETNPAFERLTGLVGVAGKTARALVPDVEGHWIETYGRVAATGERARLVEESAALGRWFEVEAFRVDAPEHRRVAILFTDVTQRKRAESQIHQLNATLEARVTQRTEQVRQLAARLAGAEERERQRIALVLHDDLQQQLAGLAILLSVLWRAAPSGDTQALQARADQILQDASTLTRTLASELSPPPLASDDLAPTLHWLAERTREMHQLDVSVEVDPPCTVPDADVRALLYHALRELLFNVVKHAGTEQATVRARRDGADVVVEVADDGDGFDADGLDAGSTGVGGLGLVSVRERVEHTGGHVAVDAEPGRGTRVTITVPAGEPPADEPPAGEA